jgi:pSer/pThr/pTyr-binding forkhead associated (FHA) protein
MYCNNCGHKNPEGSHFCSSCGKALFPSDTPTTITFSPIEVLDEEQEIQLTQGPLTSNAVLVTKRGPAPSESYELNKELTTIGRHPDSDIYLDDITVSRRHAEILKDGSSYVVKDVGSLNGTYVNKERIEQYTLRNGDELQIGKFKLIFFGPEG